jgi:RNA polymerase sigma-70 factor (ECF subfamily)
MIGTTMVTAAETIAERVVSGVDGTDPVARVAGAELDRAYRLAGLLLGNAADAEDAVSAALERAWARRDQLRDAAAFQPWFDRILVNICRDLIRRRGKVRFIAIDGPVEPPSGDMFGSFLERDALLRSIGRLREDERLVVILHFWADLPLDAVADRCGWPLGTVKSRLHRALETLRHDPELEGGLP